MRATLAVVLVSASALLLAACGSDGDEVAAEVDTEAPSASEFPAPAGRSSEQLVADIGATNEIVVSPAGQTYEPGENRFSFGVFTVDRSQISDAEVAIYAGHGPTGVAKGPFPARIESLATDPAFEAVSTASDPDAATVAYVSDLDFDRPGEWRIVAVIKGDGRLTASRLPSIEVGSYEKIPDVGEPAPRVETPIVGDVGDITEIETRSPPDTMHEVDLQDAIGKEPVVLLFATPALCTSRVCGPVVDVTEQVKSEMADQAAFIHQEVYVDNDPNKGIRPQLRAYGLQTEPWLFVLDGSGRVSSRIEGPFSVTDLEDAVRRARAES